jgi:hypothetical protein
VAQQPAIALSTFTLKPQTVVQGQPDDSTLLPLPFRAARSLRVRLPCLHVARSSADSSDADPAEASRCWGAIGLGGGLLTKCCTSLLPVRPARGGALLHKTSSKRGAINDKAVKARARGRQAAGEQPTACMSPQAQPIRLFCLPATRWDRCASCSSLQGCSEGLYERQQRGQRRLVAAACRLALAGGLAAWLAACLSH